MKKFLFTFLLLITAWATVGAYDFKVDGIAYNILDNGTVEVTFDNYDKSLGYPRSWAHSSYSGDVTIPSTVMHNGTTYTVTQIGSAFPFCTSLTSITMPNTLTYIGGYAFQQCYGLTSISIPNSVTKIEINAFESCI